VDNCSREQIAKSTVLPLPSVQMHLASDYIHPYGSAGGRPARCRIRIYLPEDEQDAPVVICSELPNNSGTSVTYAAEQLAVEVIRSHRLPTPLVWEEHWPEESTDGGEETFELVVFSSYKVEERAPYLGETRARVGDATWKRLDRATVEVLVGEKL
jgi:hypothetical protein